MNLILLIVLVVLLSRCNCPRWPYSANWGYFPSGALGDGSCYSLDPCTTRQSIDFQIVATSWFCGSQRSGSFRP